MNLRRFVKIAERKADGEALFNTGKGVKKPDWAPNSCQMAAMKAFVAADLPGKCSDAKGFKAKKLCLTLKAAGLRGQSDCGKANAAARAKARKATGTAKRKKWGWTTKA